MGTSSFSMVFHILLDCRGGDVVLRVLGKCEVYERYPRRNNVNTVCGRDKWNNMICTKNTKIIIYLEVYKMLYN